MRGGESGRDGGEMVNIRDHREGKKSKLRAALVLSRKLSAHTCP